MALNDGILASTTSAMDLPAVDLIDHIDDWIEYLAAMCKRATEVGTRKKYERQLKYLVRFRSGANSNIHHNLLLNRFYSHCGMPEDEAEAGDTEASAARVKRSPDSAVRQAMPQSMAIRPGPPVQDCYLSDSIAYEQVTKALVSDDLFFLQGPPGTGKTTAIVEIVLQTIRCHPQARILITSETHTAVDNALDRLTQLLDRDGLDQVLRYPRFGATQLENPGANAASACERANVLWRQAHAAAPDLTAVLWQQLPRSPAKEGEREDLPRWMVRQLGDKHRIVGVTCNQVDHLLDGDSEPFDLAVIDECSKATLPEWIMAMSVARKCVLVGDHRQLPPTFCEEELEVLDSLGEAQAKLIRDGVIERLFDNLPVSRRGTLLRQYRMLPHIGERVSRLFYGGRLTHARQQGDGPFQDFGWLSYEQPGLKIPQQGYGGVKVLVNPVEVSLIVGRLRAMHRRLVDAGRTSPQQRLNVAVITPYRAQCRELRREIQGCDLGAAMSIEIDTVDAFQGRQADVVFFSFVRTHGPARFFADARRLNVALSRARDCVYLVGDVRYLSRQRVPALKDLSRLPILNRATLGSFQQP